MKRVLSTVEYVCGSVLSEYGDVYQTDGNRDLAVLDKVFTRENLACSSNIEILYYSTKLFVGKKICIFCGKGGNNLIISDESFPKCQNCKDKKDIKNTKRKIVIAKDMVTKKKKTY